MNIIEDNGLLGLFYNRTVTFIIFYFVTTIDVT